jgi:hypothetical protein
MLGISASNWSIICTDYESVPLEYCDPELDVLNE